MKNSSADPPDDETSLLKNIVWRSKYISLDYLREKPATDYKTWKKMTKIDHQTAFWEIIKITQMVYFDQILALKLNSYNSLTVQEKSWTNMYIKLLAAF